MKRGVQAARSISISANEMLVSGVLNSGWMNGWMGGMNGFTKGVPCHVRKRAIFTRILSLASFRVWSLEEELKFESVLCRTFAAGYFSGYSCTLIYHIDYIRVHQVIYSADL